MALAEKGRRRGPERQAARAPAAPAAAATTAQIVDLNRSALDRAKAFRLGRHKNAPQTSAAGLVRELDQACNEIARQRRAAASGAATLAARPAAENAIVKASPAEKALQKLQAAAHVKVLQERAERLAAENALLAQKLSARERALAEQDARIKSLQQQLSAAGQGTAGQADDRQNEQRAASDHLQQKLVAVTNENARLALAATGRERVLADARIRIEYLEAALAAAELECARRLGEVSGVRDKQQTETSALKARCDEMAKRAATAENLLAEARERLLARIIEIDGLRKRAAQADAAAGAAYDRQCQLEDALCLQQSQYEELERSQTKLAAATKALLHRFRDRERALAAADEKIKALAVAKAE
jgi:chromosome segregation ATPase